MDKTLEYKINYNNKPLLYGGSNDPENTALNNLLNTAKEYLKTKPSYISRDYALMKFYFVPKTGAQMHPKNGINVHNNAFALKTHDLAKMPKCCDQSTHFFKDINIKKENEIYHGVYKSANQSNDDISKMLIDAFKFSNNYGLVLKKFTPKYIGIGKHINKQENLDVWVMGSNSNIDIFIDSTFKKINRTIFAYQANNIISIVNNISATTFPEFEKLKKANIIKSKILITFVNPTQFAVELFISNYIQMSIDDATKQIENIYNQLSQQSTILKNSKKITTDGILAQLTSSPLSKQMFKNAISNNNADLLKQMVISAIQLII